MHVGYTAQKIPVSGQFNEWPVPFCFSSLVVCYPFMIRSYSFQFLFEIRVHFPSVSNLFYIRSVFAISWHMAVYD